MDIEVHKLVVYRFYESPKFKEEDISIAEEIIGALEGAEAYADLVDDKTMFVFVEQSEGGGYIENFIDLIFDRMRSLHNTLMKLEDEEQACEIALAFAEPCTEVYVCWNHRKIWEIDTTYIGSQLDNPPKTCKECKHLIEKAKEAEKKAEQEICESDLYDDWEWE